MKLTIEVNPFRKVLAHVQRVVERRNTIPILANVLLSAKGERLTLRATDLDIEVQDSVEAAVAAPGDITVPAHILYDIVRKFPDGAEAAIELDGPSLKIRSGRSKFSLQTLPTSDYPSLTAGEFKTTFSMPAKDLKNLLGRVEFAISTEETRYYLNGIYLHTVAAGNRKLLRAVATDGHRLAQAQLDAPVGAEQFAGIIVPRKTVGEIAKLVEKPDEPVGVELSDTKIRVAIGSIILTSKLIDGTFPDYVRVIPQGNDKILKINRKDFLGAVDRVSTISSERGRAVKLTSTKGKLELSVSNPDSGSAVEELGADYGADDIEIGFNSRYLLDVAGQLAGETTEVRMADPGSPTLLQDPAEPDTLYVLMPMRV